MLAIASDGAIHPVPSNKTCGGDQMSPRTYSLIWAACGLVAAILWMGGVFSLLVGVVFGFIAFGLVFVGMMCVLPGTVSHPAPASKAKAAEKIRSHAAVIPRYRSV